MTYADLPAHFWSKVDKSGECWEWMGSRTDGYGRFGSAADNSISYKTFGTSLAYRIAWVAENGPVPDGLELDHLCNNRACVNPDHLEPVTHQVNIQRRFERRTTCPNGHPIEGNRVPHYDVAHGDRCLICRRERNRESVRRQRARKIPVGQIVPWDVRVWAWANGVPCGRMGQVPAQVVDAYLEATGQVSA